MLIELLAELLGVCVASVGPQGDVQVALPDMLLGVSISLGAALPLCGLHSQCPPDSVSVGVYSGTENAKPPYICISGRM